MGEVLAIRDPVPTPLRLTTHMVPRLEPRVTRHLQPTWVGTAPALLMERRKGHHTTRHQRRLTLVLEPRTILHRREAPRAALCTTRRRPEATQAMPGTTRLQAVAAHLRHTAVVEGIRANPGYRRGAELASRPASKRLLFSLC